VPGGASVARAIAEHLARSRSTYAVVVATRDRHVDPGPHFSDHPDFVEHWPPHCVVGTPGAELHPALADARFDAIVDKGAYQAAYSGFEGVDAQGRSLAKVLADAGVRAVDVCGIATDHCVRATALDALREGLAVRLLEDLCVGVAPGSIARAFEELRGAGVEIASSRAVVPNVALTCDVVVVRGPAGQREVLLVERGRPPYRGAWALPGGFVDPDEDLHDAALRELAEETGLRIDWSPRPRDQAGVGDRAGMVPRRIEQLGTYGRPGRDPRGRVVSVVLLADVPDAPDPIAGDDAAKARFWPLEQLDRGDPAWIAFDHREIIEDALARLGESRRPKEQEADSD
jgi:nicotinamidase/pyrazinamidase